MIIAVDFDGTCVDHRYPGVGVDVPHATEYLQHFVTMGAKLILWTMRSSDRTDGTDPLTDAMKWFAERGIPLYGVNQNPDQSSWTASPKVYAHAYVDDSAINCPLRQNPRMGGRPFVDWSVVGPMVMDLIYRKKY
jgi:hypothetical protein